jgi:CheY-like chemotaxis protein
MIDTREALPAPRRADGPTVLVVEDEVLIRMMIADELRNAGYSVIEAANAHEAAEVLSSGKAEVALVLSDVRMPGSMDGVSLARFIRATNPSVKILLTSGHLNEVGWANHDWFFRKPYEVTDVIKHIESLLSRERTSEPSL